MSRSLTLITALALGGLLCGASECEEGDACGQGPQGELSAWSECELYGQDQTIWIHLTNEGPEEMAYLSACDGPLAIEVLGEDGRFAPYPSPIQCADAGLTWAPLPSPGEVEAAAWPVMLEEGTMLPPGTYRAAYTVGWGCALGWTDAPASTACAETAALVSAPFTIYGP